MRILYSCPLNPQYTAAAGGHAISVAQELAHLGHAVTLIHMGRPIAGLEGARQIALTCSLPRLARPIWRNVALACAVAREWRSGSYDILYHRLEKSTFLPLVVAKAGQMPTLVEVNSDLRTEPAIQRAPWLRRKFLEWNERANYRRADHLIVVAEGIKHSLATVCGIPEEKISVIPNGADLRAFRPLEREHCCQHLGLDPARRYVAFSGTFQLWQGLGTIVQSAAYLQKAHPEATYLLVGDGPERAKIEAEMRSLGVAEAFLLPGWCSPEQTALYLGASDMCLAPYSRDAVAAASVARDTRGAPMRGSPLKIYTYLAAGRPVIASDFAEAGLLVEKLGAGLAVPPENPQRLAEGIARLLESPAEAASMGRIARQAAEQSYSWRAVAERIADICRRVKAAHAR